MVAATVTGRYSSLILASRSSRLISFAREASTLKGGIVGRMSADSISVITASSPSGWNPTDRITFIRIGSIRRRCARNTETERVVRRSASPIASGFHPESTRALPYNCASRIALDASITDDFVSITARGADDSVSIRIASGHQTPSRSCLRGKAHPIYQESCGTRADV